MPSEWKTRDIEKLFAAIKCGNISFHWVDQTSSFLKFENTKGAELAMAHYQSEKDSAAQGRGTDNRNLMFYKLERYPGTLKAANGPDRSLADGAENSGVNLMGNLIKIAGKSGNDVSVCSTLFTRKREKHHHYSQNVKIALVSNMIYLTSSS